MESNQPLAQFTNANFGLAESLEEVLSNSRSQLKLLSSPAELLPPAYIRDVLRNMTAHSGFEGGPFTELPPNHKVWRELRLNIETLRELAKHNLESQSDENLRKALHNISYGLDNVAYNVNYIYETFYGGPLFSAFDRSEPLAYVSSKG